jgi:hypothetical protein
MSPTDPHMWVQHSNNKLQRLCSLPCGFFFHSSSEHNIGCHCKGVLFTYYLRTVCTPTKLVAMLSLTSLPETHLPHYSKLGYLITQAQVGICSHGTQLTPSAPTQASDQQHTTQLCSPHILHDTCFACVYV